MPSWVPGVGFSSPDASKLRSPDSAFSVSSTSSDTKRMAMIESGSGMAAEGLQVAATRGSLRDDSAPSRGTQSAASLPPLEDATARDRSPRRRDPIEDGSDGASSSFGPQRSRAGIERDLLSRFPITVSGEEVARGMVHAEGGCWMPALMTVTILRTPLRMTLLPSWQVTR